MEQSINNIKQSSNTKRSTIKLAIWTGLWVITMAIGTFGPKYVWGDSGDQWITSAVILINFCIGLGMIYVNIEHLKNQDELMQKIQLEAMGIALGIGVVGGLTYSLLDITDVMSFDAEIGFLVILISLTYLGACFLGYRRYQ